MTIRFRRALAAPLLGVLVATTGGGMLATAPAAYAQEPSETPTPEPSETSASPEPPPPCVVVTCVTASPTPRRTSARPSPTASPTPTSSRSRTPRPATTRSRTASPRPDPTLSDLPVGAPSFVDESPSPAATVIDGPAGPDGSGPDLSTLLLVVGVAVVVLGASGTVGLYLTREPKGE